jgi:type I restriction enzyme S subunit
MVRSEWPRLTIESLIDSGAILAHKDGNYGSLYPRVEEFGTVGVPFLTAKSLANGTVDIDGAPRLAEEHADALKFGFVFPNDVLLSHNATVGRIAVMPEFNGRVLVGTSLTYFRLDPCKLFPRYFAAFLKGTDFQNQLAAVMSHSTRNQVPITAQRTLRVIVPPLDVQERIARTLGSLDDKIELNRRRSRALERLARAIFRAWFVDFEPVHAKAAGATSFPSMPQEVFDALPTRFTNSPIGPIPEGWRVQTLGDIAKEVRHAARPAEIDSSTPYIGLEHMPQRSIALTNWEPVAKVTSNKSRFRRGQILFGKLRPYFHKVGVAPVDGVCSTDIVVVEPVDESFSAIAIGVVSSDEFVAYTNACSTGTKMPRTKWSDMKRYSIALGPSCMIGAYRAIVHPMIELVIAGIHESRKLVEIRDYLLPKLLSGEVRVREAENIAQEIG